MEELYQDKMLRCRDCGTEFVWTAGEQQFYESKGLVNQPGRCPACRALAKSARQTGTTLPSRPREFFPAICARCGVQTKVPFFPKDDRPVYCSSCFDIVRAERMSYSTP
jgi:CxxC-x17-CxxC domain-containing protein